MTIDVNIKDNFDGTKRGVRVDPSGAIITMENAYPPTVRGGGMRVFRQYLTDDGLSTGSNDMQVAGTLSAPIPFWIPAQQEEDLYLSMLSFVIADAGATLNDFGNVTALTNGCTLTYEDEKGEVTIHDALKSNWDFVRLCAGNPAFGTGTGAFRASNVISTSEGYIPILDLRATFGFRWGVRLTAGTKQKLTLSVRDTTTGVDQFDCVAYGFTIPV